MAFSLPKFDLVGTSPIQSTVSFFDAEFDADNQRLHCEAVVRWAAGILAPIKLDASMRLLSELLGFIEQGQFLAESYHPMTSTVCLHARWSAILRTKNR